jgi:hypothetical protein
MRDAAMEGTTRAYGVQAYLLGGNPFWDNDRPVLFRHDPTTLGKRRDRHADARCRHAIGAREAWPVL